MRPGVLVAFGALLAPAVAFAQPEIEASGFAGVAYISEAAQLGDSWAPEQRPGTAPLLGARLGLISPAVVEQNDLRVQLGLEVELAMAASFTGSTSFGDGARDSYFAPVFGWRAHALGRIRTTTEYQFHLLGGAGGETVASSSPFMRKETDPVMYWGAGFAIPVGDSDLHIRADVRHGLIPARTGGSTSMLELQLGVAGTFDVPRKKVKEPPRKDLPPPQPIVDEHDSDGDGLPDRIDTCPTEAETANGLADGDGCPEPDSDGDRVIGAADTCPDLAEDKDGYQDEDGCPELDNDADGLEDVRDRCPGKAEVGNGFEDDDGCPDELPAEVGKTLAAAARITFEANRARVTDKAKSSLAPIVALLGKYPSLRVVVIGHPVRAGAADLARRRADAVKWHLIDDGMIPEERLETGVGEVKKSPAIELVLVVR
ncbi:MAG: OmpA family protein [Myxococcales bacterium]|nr:OmpA family protein [Myxococcales bacterium]